MHEAIVALHDRHGRGEPESGAAARLLRREEGIEDPIQDVGAYAGAGVRYSRDDVRSHLAIEVHRRIRVIEYDVLEAHGDRAFVGDEIRQYRHREHDGSEHVVEIVCDAAGEGTDALHALRTKNLLLELLALGEIEHEAHALVPAVLERRRADEDGNPRPILPSVFLFIRTADAIGGELLQRTPLCLGALRGRHVLAAEAAARQRLPGLADALKHS